MRRQQIFVSTVLFLSCLLEGSLFSFPLVLVVLVLFAVLTKDVSVFIYALFAGIFLDVLLLRPFGLTSAFFLSFLFVTFLYERKYEIRTVPFVLVMTALGTVIYAVLFQIPHVFLQVIYSMILGTFGFLFMTKRVVIIREEHALKRL